LEISLSKLAETDLWDMRMQLAPLSEGPSRPQPNKVGQIRRENYEKIIAAAEEVFAERGYEGASTSLIATKAGLPKANVHYYFPTKLDIYKAVMSSIFDLWAGALDNIDPKKEPAEALAQYVRSKINYSRTRPLASRVYANEVIRGAPVMQPFLASHVRKWVREKCLVFESWAKAGKMKPLANPEHLFFILWASTQSYADFNAHMCVILDKKKLSESDYDAGAKLITQLVLAGCGISERQHVNGRARDKVRRRKGARRRVSRSLLT
jgi:TetR/AcrR family transcriptional regulator